MRDMAFMHRSVTDASSAFRDAAPRAAKVILRSFDPWFIARHRPNAERTALTSLARTGFEAWFPTYLDIRPTPLRKLTASKRRLAHLHVTEIRRPRFPGYLLVRPLPVC